MAESEVEHLDSIIQRGRPLHKSDYLFRAGEPFQAVYAVRSGCLKTYSVFQSGEERITGFHLPGEIVGLDAIADKCHQQYAQALETSMVCTIPYSKLDELSGELPSLRKQMINILSKELSYDQTLLNLLSNKKADERLAAFFVNISERHRIRGLSATHIRLPMTRAAIANYLGLAHETISRLLNQLTKKNLISIKGSELVITDLAELSKLAGIECHDDKQAANG